MWLGVDGGGTKTEVVLASEEGVVGYGLGGPSNHQVVGMDGAINEVNQLVHRIMDDADIRQSELDRVVLGLAGADFPEDIEALTDRLRQVFGAVPFVVVNDAEIALKAGTDQPFGVVAVAGTGANVFGKNAQGRSLHIGGLGFEYGDLGSGIDIAREVMHYAFRSVEERGVKTILEDLVLQMMGQPDYEHLRHAMYFHEIPEFAFLVLAPLCFQAAAQGDQVAIDILSRQGAAVAQSVTGMGKLLGMLGQPCDVVMTGSLWLGQAPHFREEFLRSLHGDWPQASAQITVFKPVVGAVLMACEDGQKESQLRLQFQRDGRLLGIE